MGKIALRIEIKKTLENISEAERGNKSEELSRNLQQLINTLYIQEKKSDGFVVGGFSPIQKEPIWHACFTGLELEVREYANVHMYDERKISFHHFKDLEFGELFSQGLQLGEDKEMVKTLVEPDIILVPGLAFTSRKERLGRGKGYFDSYLENFKGISIGVCFEDQLVDMVYSEAHDKKVNYLITNKKIY